MFLNKRKNGIYYLCFTDELSGKRKMISTKQRYKPKALNFVTIYKSQKKNELTKNKLIVFYVKDLQNEVLKYAVNNFRSTTVQIYKRVFKDMLRIIGNIAIKLIDTKCIENYKNVRSNEVSSAMVNIDLTTMKAIFNIAIKFDWCNINPVKKVNKLQIPEQEHLAFSDAEYNMVYNNIKDLVIKDFVQFAYLTGLRLNEICNIQIKDVNLNENVIKVMNKPDFKIKTGKVRYIPIDTDLETLIKKIIGIEGNIISLLNPDLYLFRNDKGFKFDKTFVSKKFKEALRLCQLPEKFHFHCLRHTRITKWIKDGLPIAIVMKLAGHLQMSTSLNYTHIAISDIKKALLK